MDMLLVVPAYLIGSLSSAILICRLSGLSDPRSAGSGNPGATNMLRLYGKRLAFLVLLGDMLKGVLPVLFVWWWTGGSPIMLAATGLAVFLGHLYPVFFNFRGGKGVATLVGVLWATTWQAGACFTVVWMLVFLACRYSSLAALTATAVMPLAVWLSTGELVYVGSFSLMGLWLFWRHRRNIRDLLRGQEGKS